MKQNNKNSNFKYGTDIDLIFARSLTFSKEVKLLTELSFKQSNKIKTSKTQLMRDAKYYGTNFNRSIESLNKKLGTNIQMTNNEITGAKTHCKGNTFTTIPTYLIKIADKINLTGSAITLYWYLNSSTRNNNNVWNGNLDTLTRNLNKKLQLHNLNVVSYDQVRRAINILKCLKLINYSSKISKHKLTGMFYGRVQIKLLSVEKMIDQYKSNWTKIESNKIRKRIDEDDDLSGTDDDSNDFFSSL